MPEEIFRFTLLRPPQRRAYDGQNNPLIKAYSGAQSDFAQEITGQSRSTARALARRFLDGSNYVAELSDLKIPLAAFDKALFSPAKVKADNVRTTIEDIFGAPAGAVVSSDAFQSERERLADSLLAATLADLNYVPGQENLVRGLQLCAVIETLADPEAGIGDLRAALNGLVVLPGLHHKPEPAQKKAAKQPTAKERDLKKRIRELIDIRGAISDLQRLYRRKKLGIGVRGPHIDEKRAELPDVARLDPADNKMLSPATKRVFVAYKIPAEGAHIPGMIKHFEGILNAEMKEVAGEAMQAPGGIIIVVPTPYGQPVPLTTGRVRVAGVGDLLVVRQRIKRYELGEIAHIENALRGESFGRTFRRKEGLEIVEFEEIEKIESTERDLQSTSKFELRSEAERTIEENMKAQAGVTVTARGPMIEVSANAGFSYERSSEESSKTATNFAREVVDRSVNRIQERVLQRRSSKVTQEVEEASDHRIDNTAAPDHMIGIYRWVEKIYEAQIVNYGQRLMLEFVVPEPAAFYRMAQQNKRPPNVSGDPPDPPQVLDLGDNEYRPLKVGDLNGQNYLDWVGQYNVTGVAPPPPEEIFIGIALEQPAKEGGDSVSKAVEQGTLKVEDGYVAKEIRVDYAGERDGDEKDVYWEIIVGTEEFKKGSIMQRYLGWRRDNYNSNIPVSMVVKKYGAFTANIVVRCERTDAAFEDWQMQTFSSIMNRYNNLKADYDDRVAAAQIQTGVGISGNNPAVNRDIEHNELKRLAIAMVSGQNFDLFNAMSDSGEPLRYPQVVDFAEAESEGNYIQFLEQALEWQHMTYVFYPYFWGRKGGWVDVLNSDDVDPLFGQFLRAGAARVQVPVRPGFVEAMDYFLKRGIPWNGGEPPHIEDSADTGDPPFIPIIQELREQTGAEFEDGPGTVQVIEGSSNVRGVRTRFDAQRDVDREIRIAGKVYRIREVLATDELTLWEQYAAADAETLPYSLGPKLVGQPWEVRLPTTLVMLQQDSTLPTF